MRAVYDVRAVRFIKATRGKDSLENNAARYICLGHFDLFEVDSLSENGCMVPLPLRTIQDDRIHDNEKRYEDADTRVYSLYMLQKIADTQVHKRLQDFWERKSVFMTITRIHCKSSRDCDFQSESCSSQTISSCLRKFCNIESKEEQLPVLCSEGSMNGSVIVLKAAVAGNSNQEKEHVECVFYDSLELGDTVAVMKSASLSAILEVVRYLSTADNVRDTYTYCGILSSCFSPGSTYYLNSHARIQQLTTRFSIRNVQRAKEYFDRLEKKLKKGRIDKQFYVTGTADHLIQWCPCDESSMLEIVQLLLETDIELPGCFNDVITRVGLDYLAPDGAELTEGMEKSAQWHECFLKIQKKCVSQEWLYPLRKLLGALFEMKRNYVMDGLAALLIPGVNAFLQRLDAMSEKELEDHTEDINFFLRVWADLSNDISQLESQLTQHPELAPIRYYIPALLLQFELKFLEKSAFSLSEPNKRSFRPMLVTTDEFNMYTVCPLDPKGADYNRECPLLVFVPVRDLYSVWEIALRATHEAAHYCEDSARNRNLRYKKLTECMAHAVINTWFKDVVRPIIQKSDEKKFYSNGLAYEKKLTEAIKHFADKKIKNIRSDEEDGIKDVYLDLCVVAIRSGVEEVLKREDFLEQYLLCISPDFFVNYRHQYQLTLGMRSWSVQSLVQQQDLSTRLSALKFLCGECYADIAMILLLNLKFEDYYASVYKDEYNHILEMGYDVEDFSSSDIICHIHRMAQVISVMSSLGKETWNAVSINEDSSAWIRYAHSLLTWLYASQEGWDSSRGVLYSSEQYWRPEMLDYTTFQLLNDYLLECAKKLEEELNQKGDGNEDRAKAIQEVRKSVCWISDSGFDWEKIQQFLLEDSASQSKHSAVDSHG